MSRTKCSCGARGREKCVEESTSGYGKMCVRSIKEHSNIEDSLEYTNKIIVESEEEIK